jgi:hypothetical protein
MEDGLMTMFSVGGGSAIAADMALARVGMLRAAEQGAVTASQRAAVQAAERTVLGIAEESGAELGGSRVEQLLAGARNRLNPMNYEVRGLGSNFGNIKYRGPRPPAPTSAGTAAEFGEAQVAMDDGTAQPLRPRLSGREHGNAGTEWEETVRRMSGGKSEQVGTHEIDSVTETELIQAKDCSSACENPRNFLGQRTRKQVQATVDYAEEHGKRAVYWFRNEPHPEVRQYIERKGAEVRVGTEGH